MLAEIQKADHGYTARFERRLKHPVASVWAFLTENTKLKKWFAELQIDDLREGGVIKFDMQDGTFEEMRITGLQLNAVLAYTWGEDNVRFELYPDPQGCQLVLIEQINKVTSHTPKDLAGWHVCLDVIQTLLDGRTIESRYEEWKKWYAEYDEAVRTITRAG